MHDCETYKEAIAAEPWAETAGDHASTCETCRAFRAEMRALDRRIEAALKLDVPPLELPDLKAVDTDNVATLTLPQLRAPAWLAIAATVIIAAVLGIRMVGSGIDYPTLADEIVAHLDHEPYALRITDKAVSDERLARVVPASVATLDHSAGLITYAQSCIINGNRVPHLVLQGQRGPVTILLMPEEKINGPERIDGSAINGVILPVGDGSIAIVGEKDEDLERIEDNVRNSVAWSI